MNEKHRIQIGPHDESATADEEEDQIVDAESQTWRWLQPKNLDEEAPLKAPPISTEPASETLRQDREEASSWYLIDTPVAPPVVAYEHQTEEEKTVAAVGPKEATLGRTKPFLWKN